jgi:hypothetical protein
MSTPGNVVFSPVEPNMPTYSYLPWALFGVLAILFIVVAVGVYQWIQNGSFSFSTWFRKEEQEMDSQVKEYKPESWCFVGEDVVGRWCVRVPNPHSCTPDRLFDSEDNCTYVSASALPLGVVKEGGAEYKPFAPPMPAMANTF